MEYTRPGKPTGFVPLHAAPHHTAHSLLVLNGVAEHYGVAASELIGKQRSLVYAEPRFVAMWCLHQRTYSKSDIGRLFGRDHSTICNALVQAEARFLDIARILTQQFALQLPVRGSDSGPPAVLEQIAFWVRYHIARRFRDMLGAYLTCLITGRRIQGLAVQGYVLLSHEAAVCAAVVDMLVNFGCAGQAWQLRQQLSARAYLVSRVG